MILQSVTHSGAVFQSGRPLLFCVAALTSVSKIDIMEAEERKGVILRMINNKRIAAYYDRLIELGDDPVYDPNPLAEYMDRWDGPPFLEALELSDSKDYLEIGVGSGRLALRVAPYCRRFVGIDLSPKTVERAAENLSGCPGVTLVCGDFLTHSFGERFDTIYSSLTFFHISGKAEAISKVYALLKEGGRFVLSLEQEERRTVDFSEELGIELFPDDPKQIEGLMQTVGFRLAPPIDLEAAILLVGDKPQS